MVKNSFTNFAVLKILNKNQFHIQIVDRYYRFWELFEKYDYVKKDQSYNE